MVRISFIAAVATGFSALCVDTAFAGLTAGQLFGVNSGEGGQFLVMIDKTDGSVTNLGPTGITIDGLAFSPGNVLYAADNTSAMLVTLDTVTGAVSDVIGPFFAGTIEGLAFHPTTGALYGIDVSDDVLVSIDTNTGEAVKIGSFGGPASMAGLTWSADGSTLYGVDWSDGGLYEIDSNTGQAQIVGFGDAGGAGGPLGLATDPTDGLLYTAEWQDGADMTLATVSTADGSRQHVGTMFGAPQIEGLAFTVPAPGALAVLGLAGLTLGYRRRRVSLNKGERE